MTIDAVNKKFFQEIKKSFEEYISKHYDYKRDKFEVVNNYAHELGDLMILRKDDQHIKELFASLNDDDFDDASLEEDMRSFKEWIYKWFIEADENKIENFEMKSMYKEVLREMRNLLRMFVVNRFQDYMDNYIHEYEWNNPKPFKDKN